MDNMHCSFCGKGSEQAGHLTFGSGRSAICNSCVETIVNSNSERQELSGLSCNFCGKEQEEVEHITSGPGGVHICNECIALAREMINEAAMVRDTGSSGTPGV